MSEFKYRPLKDRVLVEPHKAEEKTASAAVGLFNADVPSNIPLEQVFKKAEELHDDDPEENELGLEIVPYN